MLVRGDLPRLVLTSDLNRLLGLEGCLSGNVPAGAVPPGGAGGPCARLGASQPGAGRLRAGDVHQLRPSRSSPSSCRGARRRARRRPTGRARRPRSSRWRRGTRKARAGELGEQAEKLVYAQFAHELLSLNAKYGLNLTGAPKLNDPDFVYQLVFDPARGERAPKARFAYLFPSSGSALISCG